MGSSNNESFHRAPESYESPAHQLRPKIQEDLKEEISLASRKMLLEACEPKPGEKLYNAAVYAGRDISAGLVMGSIIGGPYGTAAGGIIGAIGAIGDYSIANKASQMECVKNKLQTW